MTSTKQEQSNIVSFHDISYDVQIKEKKHCGVTSKRILFDVSGIFKNGMNAILGPTGGGKTTLLDIMAARKDPKGLSGQVLINGGKQKPSFRLDSGYVTQEDTVMGTLTVRENIMFSANLRLPPSVKSAEKAQRVNDCLSELGLLNCADQRVGTEFIRGVSGGEKKRTNIGMELVISPVVLFLDEPTTGLDSSTSNAVMYLLKRLSQSGRTIIFSIHQPRYSIFRLFDCLTLLSRGHSVYHGPASQALDHFSSMGYECEVHNNPSDFFLDVINGDSSAVVKNDELTHPKADDTSVVDVEDMTFLSDKLATGFKNSQWNAKLRSELNEIETSFNQSHTDNFVIDNVNYANNFFIQFFTLSKRTSLNLLRNPFVTIIQMMVILIFAFIVGFVYLRMDSSLKSGVQNRVGAFFFVTMNQIFGNLSAVTLFIKERVLFIHETSNGFYAVSAFFFSKLICDLLPMRIIPLSFFSVIIYFMIGLQLEVTKYFIFLLTLMLTTLSASSIAFFVSSSVEEFSIANLLVSLIYVFMMLFGGLLVNIDSIVIWLRWIQYLSIVRYSLSALYVNELKGMEFCGSILNQTVCEKAGEAYLDDQGIAYATDWDLWKNHLALGLLFVGFLILSYIQLRRINKFK